MSLHDFIVSFPLVGFFKWNNPEIFELSFMAFLWEGEHRKTCYVYFMYFLSITLYL